MSPASFSAKLAGLDISLSKSGNSVRPLEWKAGPLVREFSAGGVVLRKMRGRWFVAVIEPHVERPKKAPAKAVRRTRKQPDEVAALPKGAIHEGERPEQTALREVEEETGVQAELVGKLGDVRYVYVRNWGDKARVFKVVSFYLLLYRSGKLGEISPEMRIEVQRAYWLPLDEAPVKLSYKGERGVAELALQYLSTHPDLESEAAESAHRAGGRPERNRPV